MSLAANDELMMLWEGLFLRDFSLFGEEIELRCSDDKNDNQDDHRDYPYDNADVQRTNYCTFSFFETLPYDKYDKYDQESERPQLKGEDCSSQHHIDPGRWSGDYDHHDHHDGGDHDHDCTTLWMITIAMIIANMLLSQVDDDDHHTIT